MLKQLHKENQQRLMEEDWDLQAVVRGCCSSSSAAASSPPLMDDGFGCFQNWGFQEEDNTNNLNDMFSFPDLFETRTSVEELDQLCNPFIPRFQLPISPLSNLSNPISLVPPTLQQVQVKPEYQQLQLQQQQQQQPRKSIPHRPKRRKNQQKKVVRHVPQEELSSDVWAWRKYGQKPIKGSPYPRGYYRCSSSKGCLARKQVERSKTDPQIFIVTYTAEHNHAVPTHRNSLAGSTRHKIASSGTTTTLKAPSTTTTTSPPTMGLSPLTPSTEEDDEHIKLEEGEDDDDLGISKLQELMSDDLFMELDQFVGNTSTPSDSAAPGVFDDCFTSPHWFSAAASATAAGGV